MDLLRTVDKLSGILSLANVRGNADDFFIDRLSSKFTTGLLCAFAILCGMKSSFTVPIICWIPAQLRRYERAITAYCYANNTYYVADHLRVPPTAEERYESLIIYYQWLPWIFGVQAILTYAPKLIWRVALAGSRQNVRDLLQAAAQLYAVPKFEKNKNPSKIREDQIIYLNSILFDRQTIAVAALGIKKRKPIFSCYFLICYIGVKFLYILNCLLQLGLIHLMIGSRPFSLPTFSKWRPEPLESHFIAQFVHKISSGISELIDTSAFPKRTLCDFTFRELASNHAYTVECILPLNIIVEKMYVFLYLWFILLGFITLLDFIKWIGHLIHCLISSDRTREDYVRNHLIDRSQYKPDDILNFARFHISGNNYFLLKLLSKNISTFVVVDMLDYFFKTRMSHNKKDN